MEYEMNIAVLLQQYDGFQNSVCRLVRDWIGQVYEIWKDQDRYILKIFRREYTEDAVQSVQVMDFLYQNDFPVPRIVRAAEKNGYCLTEEGAAAVIYEYVEGKEPERTGENLEMLGETVGRMRKIMERYPGEIRVHGQSFFTGRYLSVLRRKNCGETNDFARWGRTLWNRVCKLPAEFCHGDMHVGNMLENNGHLLFFDFDACAVASPVYDIATLCDGTDYFDSAVSRLEVGFIQTRKNLERFLRGYGRYYTLSTAEQSAVFDFIALRHYDIQATIIECQGLDCIDHAFIKNQYQWLVNWEKVCRRQDGKTV